MLPVRVVLERVPSAIGNLVLRLVFFFFAITALQRIVPQSIIFLKDRVKINSL